MLRIVKLELKPDQLDDFLLQFKSNRKRILNHDGCLEVRLLRDREDLNRVFTISRWKSEQHLQAYRKSEFFEGVWSKVKPMFAAKAQAWSLDEQQIDDHEKTT